MDVHMPLRARVYSSDANTGHYRYLVYATWFVHFVAVAMNVVVVVPDRSWQCAGGGQGAGWKGVKDDGGKEATDDQTVVTTCSSITIKKSNVSAMAPKKTPVPDQAALSQQIVDANPAVELLLTSDPARARVLATQIEGLNAQRRLLTSQVTDAAEAQLRQHPELLTEPAIVLSHPNWPGGVVGIA